jgi:hypothetical protein
MVVTSDALVGGGTSETPTWRNHMRSQTIAPTLLCLLAPVLAQAAAPAPIPTPPYIEGSGLTEVHASVNGQEGTFLIDTGGGISIITPKFAERIGCKPWGQITGFRLTGERLDAPHCDGVSFEMGGGKFKAPAVGVFDIMQFIGANAPPLDGSLGLDIFAGKVVTRIPGVGLVIETPASFKARIAGAKELPVRVVRDAEGLALTLNGAVQTPAGLAYMELDTGNTGTFFVGNHIAALLGMQPDSAAPFAGSLTLANGIVASGPTRTTSLIMDGNIGAGFLNHWTMTMDLEHGRLWLAPLPADAPEKKAKH